jgi:hypothetical protein
MLLRGWLGSPFAVHTVVLAPDRCNARFPGLLVVRTGEATSGPSGRGPESAAKDLGVMNIAGALPWSVAPAIAPVVLAISNGSYAGLYAVAGAAPSSGRW